MFSLTKLAKLVSGEISGNQSTKIRGVSSIETAKDGDLVFALNEKNLTQALKSHASAILAKKGSVVANKSAILVDNPRFAMAQIIKLFAPACEIEPGIHKTAIIHKTAKIGKEASIGPSVYIGPKVIVGDKTIIYPNVSIYNNTVIGKNCIIHAGVVIGIDGYGFVPVAGKFEKIPQLGRVIIGDNVEIFANTCISRGALGDTTIGRGTKIDNLTHIAHNCEIGEDCAITSLVGFAGSTKLGKHVTVGGQAGFSGHLEVGENTVIMARAGVTKNIPSNSVVSGFPAADHRKDMEIQAILRRLPQLLKKLKIK